MMEEISSIASEMARKAEELQKREEKYISYEVFFGECFLVS